MRGQAAGTYVQAVVAQMAKRWIACRWDGEVDGNCWEAKKQKQDGIRR